MSHAHAVRVSLAGLVLLAGLAGAETPGPPDAGTGRTARICLERAAQMISTGDSIVVVPWSGPERAGFLVGFDRGAAPALRLRETGTGTTVAVDMERIRKIHFVGPGEVKAGWAILGLVGGGVLGTAMGSAAGDDSPGHINFSPLIGALLGAGTGLALGLAVPAALPSSQTLSCEAKDLRLTHRRLRGVDP